MCPTIISQMHGTGNDLYSQGNKIKGKREGRQSKCNLQLEKSHCESKVR